MKLVVFLALGLSFLPAAAYAVEAPAGQVRLTGGQVLRGHFEEEKQVKGLANLVHTSGHFIIAPSHGLIWGIEQPLPTSTIITPNGIVQDIGGMAVKLPAKNLGHVYGMVNAALAGDWNTLESDFAITRSGGNGHWQLLLVPRAGNNFSKSYSAITVSGDRFVENIVMTRPDGGYDAFTFTGTALSSAPLTQGEAALFSEATQ